MTGSQGFRFNWDEILNCITGCKMQTVVFMPIYVLARSRRGPRPCVGADSLHLAGWLALTS